MAVELLALRAYLHPRALYDDAKLLRWSLRSCLLYPRMEWGLNEDHGGSTT
jgi:hypothetical protein